MNADLSVVAPHHAATTAEQQRKLIGDMVITRDCELCAVCGYVPNYAAQRRRPAIKIDLSEIMNFESRSLAQFAKWIPRLKKTHFGPPTLVEAQVSTMPASRKRFVAPSVKPASIVFHEIAVYLCRSMLPCCRIGGSAASRGKPAAEPFFRPLKLPTRLQYAILDWLQALGWATCGDGSSSRFSAARRRPGR
jgi:hypothetical protein